MIGSPESADRASPVRSSPAPDHAPSDESAASPESATGRRQGARPERDERDHIDGDEGGGDAIGQDPELPTETGPDPLRFNRWMKRSTTGAVLTGVTIGLQQALEKRDQRPAFVIEAPGEPEDDEPLVRLQFDPDNPSKTVAVVRADAGHDRAPLPLVDDPEAEPGDTEPNR